MRRKPISAAGWVALSCAGAMAFVMARIWMGV